MLHEEFEWDEDKRREVLAERGIDFERAKEIWQGAVLEVASRTETSEQRFLAVGEAEGRVITVVYTWRGRKRRLITARRARRHEAEDYYAALGRNP